MLSFLVFLLLKYFRMKNFIKQFLYTLLFSCLFVSCAKEDLSPVATESATITLNTGGGGVDPCPKCETEDLYKTVGKEEVAGTVTVCQTEDELKITFRILASREKAWFQQTGYAIFSQVPESITPSLNSLEVKESHHGDKPRVVEYIIPLSELGSSGEPGETIYIATWAVVPGKDGVGGMVWAGDGVPEEKNPNTRYFDFKIIKCGKPEEPDKHCTYTQGYWFAKPNVDWPSPGTVTVGGNTYTKEEVQDIFKLTGKKTDARQAFLQAAALQLNLNNDPGLKDHLKDIDDPNDPCYKVLYALKKINEYFEEIGTKVTTGNISTTTTFPDDNEIREAAEKISDCLNSEHCEDE
jgi:hypothetical protein